MNKTVIKVPADVTYMSDWAEFKLFDYPHILDKCMPGCGFTELCLTNNMDLILCCPRKMLLENKLDQHRGEVFLVKSLEGDLSIDKDISLDNKKEVINNSFTTTNSSNNQATEFWKLLRNDIESYIRLRRSQGLASKILVTYDSYRKVRDIMRSLNEGDFYTVIDEFQSIFIDSRFKSSTELEFVTALQGEKKVCFVSATPMIEEYLDEMDEFKDLPYYVLDWASENSSRVIKPIITPRIVKTINPIALKIIDEYLTGKFEYRTVINEDKLPEKVESKEAVFYVNSIRNIIQIIKKSGLTPDQVNILCANNDDNQKRINKHLGPGYKIGHVPVPKNGETNKMFTFCTRTVYLGADFYSTCARSFVFSDANIDSLAVDITLDLPQIMGRQRLNENPWKNEISIYVKPRMNFHGISKEEFEKYLNGKISSTNSLLKGFSEMTDPNAIREHIQIYENMAKDYNYRDNYVSINHHDGMKPVPQMNKLAMLSEKRAFDIQQVDYADRFTIFNRLGKISGNISQEVIDIMDQLRTMKYPSDQMRLVCTCNLSSDEVGVLLNQLPSYFKDYYYGLGPDRCRACGYNLSLLKKDYSTKFFNDMSKIQEEVYNTFCVGDKKTKELIKELLGQIYKKYNYNKTAKAVDIEEYFEVTKTDTKDNTGKRINLLKLNKRKEN